MRIDKFLNAINITKNRNTSQDMISNNVVFVNSLPVKASKEIKVGDILEINYLDSKAKYKILQIPTTKTTPKSKKFEYIQEIQ